MITHFRTTQSSLLRHTIKCGDVKKVVTSKKVKGFRDTPPPPFPCGGPGTLQWQIIGLMLLPAWWKTRLKGGWLSMAKSITA